jgi:hypothetical protein
MSSARLGSVVGRRISGSRSRRWHHVGVRCRCFTARPPYGTAQELRLITAGLDEPLTTARCGRRLDGGRRRSFDSPLDHGLSRLHNGTLHNRALDDRTLAGFGPLEALRTIRALGALRTIGPLHTLVTLRAILTLGTGILALGPVSSVLAPTILATTILALAVRLPLTLSPVLAPILAVAAVEPLMPFAIVVRTLEALPVVTLLAAILAVLTEAVVALPEVPMIAIPSTVAVALLIALIEVTITVAKTLLALLARLAVVLPWLSLIVHPRLLLVGAHSHLGLLLLFAAARALVAVLAHLPIERLAGSRERSTRHSSGHRFSTVLLHLLLAKGENDAVIVLGVLEIVLSQNVIAR